MSQLDNMTRKQLAEKILITFNLWHEIGFRGLMWGAMTDDDLRKIDLSKMEVSSNRTVRSLCESILKEPYTLQDMFWDLNKDLKEGFSIIGISLNSHQPGDSYLAISYTESSAPAYLTCTPQPIQVDKDLKPQIDQIKQNISIYN